MITIFTIPKQCSETITIIQKNAIKSWLQLRPACEVILFGDDDGVSDLAAELNVKHIKLVEKNEFGTPLLSSAFSIAQTIAQNDIMMYVNSDVIFFQDLINAVLRIDMQSFLVCGRRWDLDIRNEINFDHLGSWAEELKQRNFHLGKLHGLSGIDYFIFPRNAINMLPFAVGRPGWDVWLIYDMRRKKVPVIDASDAITVIHQSHDYSHSKFGGAKRVGGPEWHANIRLAGGHTNMLTLRDADWILTKDSLRRPYFFKRPVSLISLWYPWRLLLAIKRMLRKLVDN